MNSIPLAIKITAVQSGLNASHRSMHQPGGGNESLAKTKGGSYRWDIWQCNSALTFFCYFWLVIIVTLSLGTFFFPFQTACKEMHSHKANGALTNGFFNKLFISIGYRQDFQKPFKSLNLGTKSLGITLVILQ